MPIIIAIIKYDCTKKTTNKNGLTVLSLHYIYYLCFLNFYRIYKFT